MAQRMERDRMRGGDCEERDVGRGGEKGTVGEGILGRGLWGKDTGKGTVGKGMRGGC